MVYKIIPGNINKIIKALHYLHFVRKSIPRLLSSQPLTPEKPSNANNWESVSMPLCHHGW